ncbi:MAG TPA: glycosidase [Bacteroidota bacterium]
MNAMSKHVPRVERLNGGNPILRQIEYHPWENKVTFNPACALVEDKHELASIIARLPFSDEVRKTLGEHSALCFLLYRAQGKKTPEYDFTRSSLGLAVLTADLQLLARHDSPVVRPEEDYENLGAEDGRISKVGDRYTMMYCAYSSGHPHNKIRIAHASTKDFINWEKHGLLKGEFNTVDNKNAMLFEGQVNGKHVILHRPMGGPNAMSIHWAEADDVLGEWKTRGPLMESIKNPTFIDTWIGGGAPPLRMDDGRYLIIYHIGNRKADTTREYDLGIAVADPSKAEFIVQRNEPLLRPETHAETNGDSELGVNNVVFICGAYFYKGDLYFPYAGADSVVLGGMISKFELDRYLESKLNEVRI